MAKSKAQRQASWRAKQSMKAFLFEEADKRRRRALNIQFRDTEGHTPAIRLVREAFMANPRCFDAPLRLDFDGEDFVIRPRSTSFNTAWEEFIALTVLLDAGYENIAIRHQGGCMRPPTDDPWIAEIRLEHAALKAHGLWDSDIQKLRSTPITQRRT